jgi:large subunit ribosomal protein L21
MYAIVRVSGFQFIVKEGETVTVPRLDAEAGSSVKLDDVLFLRTEDDTVIGRPNVPDSYVEAEVVDHPRAKKIMVFKFRRREKYRRKLGHRQQQTRLRISKIHTAG